MIEDRTNTRTSRLMRGTITLSGGGSHDILVQNISRKGIGIKFPGQALNIGEMVRIDVPALGVFHGTVRWHVKGRAGIELSEEIDPASARFQNAGLVARENNKFQVADRFQPSTTTYRPGFGRK